MKYPVPAFSLILISVLFASCSKSGRNDFLVKYQGIPFIDSVQSVEMQKIPGRLQCEFYDRGGDSVSYFDTDANNNGSGSLNPGTDYLSRFRIDEAPDISFTKFYDQIDNSPYNLVHPEEAQLYLGWTEPGEWTRYTVYVEKSGIYQVGAMYTSNRGGSIRLLIDASDTTGLLPIQSTFVKEDPLAWRNWHHWNYVDSLTQMKISKGRHVITLKIAEEGNFNFDYLEFIEVP